MDFALKDPRVRQWSWRRSSPCW